MYEETEIYLKLTQFIFYEAKLLDERKYEEWLNLLDEEITYEVYTPITGSLDYNLIYIADKNGIITRIRRYNLDSAWAENPPSFTCRIVSNILVRKINDEKYKVSSNIIVYRNRDYIETDHIIAHRDDIILLTENEIKLRERKIYLIEPLIKSKNISIIL